MALKVRFLKKSCNRWRYRTAIFGCRTVVEQSTPPPPTRRDPQPPPPRPQVPSSHFSGLLHHSSNSTPNPQVPSCFPIFWNWQRPKKSKSPSKRGGGGGHPQTPAGRLGRKEAPGKAARGRPGARSPPRLSSQLSALSKLVLPPDQAGPGALVRRQKGDSSSVAPRSGHGKPSLRTRVSRTVRNEVNLPAVNKENTV